MTPECDLVADLAPAQEEQRPVRSHGNGMRVETSGWTSAVSWTDSAVCAGSFFNTSAHTHACRPVPSHCWFWFLFFFNSAGCFSRQAGGCVHWSEEEEEPARWWRPSSFLAVSAAAMALTGALISWCSQSDSHGRQERDEALMAPSQRAEPSREAETDNRDHSRRQHLHPSPSLYRANLWL